MRTKRMIMIGAILAVLMFVLSSIPVSAALSEEIGEIEMTFLGEGKRHTPSKITTDISADFDDNLVINVNESYKLITLNVKYRAKWGKDILDGLFDVDFECNIKKANFKNGAGVLEKGTGLDYTWSLSMGNQNRLNIPKLHSIVFIGPSTPGEHYYTITASITPFQRTKTVETLHFTVVLSDDGGDGGDDDGGDDGEDKSITTSLFHSNLVLSNILARHSALYSLLCQILKH
jgi:hypothetical protein